MIDPAQIGLAVACGVVVFVVLMVHEPPNHLWCNRSKRHEFGRWTYIDGVNRRRCKLCGYTEELPRY